MPAAPVVWIAGSLLAAGATAVVRNQHMKAKSGATTQMRNATAAANAAYEKQKQDARNANQAPNTDALNKARQQSVLRLQQSSGRASTFLSEGLGG